MNSNGDFPRFYAGMGQQLSPSYTFGSEPVSGAYLQPVGTTTELTVVKKGQKRVRYTDDETIFEGPVVAPGLVPVPPTSLTLALGSASAPSLNFDGHTTSGIYGTSGGSVGVTYSGTQAALLSSTSASFTGSVKAGSTVETGIGAYATPSYTFTGHTTSGMCFTSVGTNSEVSISSAGSAKLSVADTYVGVTPQLLCVSDAEVAGKIKAADGDYTTPSVTFRNDTKTGLLKTYNGMTLVANGATCIALQDNKTTIIGGTFLDSLAENGYLQLDPSGMITSTAARTTTTIRIGDVTNSFTMSVNGLSYVQIGPMIAMYGSLSWTDKGAAVGSNELVIRAIPFLSAGSNNQGNVGIIGGTWTTTGRMSLQISSEANDYIHIYETPVTGPSTRVLVSQAPTAGTLRFNMIYFTA
jgi:hypothetical protein